MLLAGEEDIVFVLNHSGSLNEFSIDQFSLYGSIHPGPRMTLKNGTIFFSGETYISLDIIM